MGMFDNAPVVAAPTKASAKEKPSIILAGLRDYAELDAAIKALEAAKATIKTKVETAAMKQFVKVGTETGVCPDSFKGVEGDASASVELRKRSTASALSDDERKALEAAGITVHKAIAQQFHFGINTKYTNDKALLEKVEKALESIVPADFIDKHAEVSKFVVDETALNGVFAKAKADSTVDYSTMIRSVTTFALKPKLEKTDIAAVMKNVTNLVV
jgi:hypothetical protein